jgi:hypothetical protein
MRSFISILIRHACFPKAAVIHPSGYEAYQGGAGLEHGLCRGGWFKEQIKEASIGRSGSITNTEKHPGL